MNARKEKILAEAVQAMVEDIGQGTSFEGSLEHYASLFEVSEEDLRHEWNLIREDCR